MYIKMYKKGPCYNQHFFDNVLTISTVIYTWWPQKLSYSLKIQIFYDVSLVGPGGAAGVLPPPPPQPKGPNSFILAFVFAKKRPHRRLVDPSTDPHPTDNFCFFVHVYVFETTANIASP